MKIDHVYRGTSCWKCALVQFEEDDKNFMVDKKNWMPTDNQAMMLVKGMVEVSPTFKKELISYIKSEKAK